ncbi:PDZ domain-containing protein, partial [bacterium]|nr:PDZ domain-containing protein [candidate division CSSED10-310 bacterium]
ARHLRIDRSDGVLVSEIRSGSPSETAGIQPGDLIIQVGNREVLNTADYRAMMREYTPGDTVALTVIRDGRESVRTMQAVAVPVDRVKELTWDLMGFQIRELTRNDMRQNRIVVSEGVLVTHVRPGSPAEDVGIKPSDVIARVNRVNVTKPDTLYDQIPYVVQQDAVVLVVVRGSNAYRVILTIP